MVAGPDYVPSPTSTCSCKEHHLRALTPPRHPSAGSRLLTCPSKGPLTLSLASCPVSCALCTQSLLCKNWHHGPVPCSLPFQTPHFWAAGPVPRADLQAGWLPAHLPALSPVVSPGATGPLCPVESPSPGPGWTGAFCSRTAAKELTGHLGRRDPPESRKDGDPPSWHQGDYREASGRRGGAASAAYSHTLPLIKPFV